MRSRAMPVATLEMRTGPSVRLSQRRRGLHIRRILLVVAAVAAAIFVWQRLAPGLASASFGFLVRATGWDIAYAILPYTSRDPYWWAFLVGLTNTIGAGALGIHGHPRAGHGQQPEPDGRQGMAAHQR